MSATTQNTDSPQTCRRTKSTTGRRAWKTLPAQDEDFWLLLHHKSVRTQNKFIPRQITDADEMSVQRKTNKSCCFFERRNILFCLWWSVIGSSIAKPLRSLIDVCQGSNSTESGKEGRLARRCSNQHVVYTRFRPIACAVTPRTLFHLHYLLTHSDGDCTQSTLTGEDFLFFFFARLH